MPEVTAADVGAAPWMSRPVIMSDIPGGIGLPAVFSVHTSDGAETVHVNQVPVPGPAEKAQALLGAVIVNALSA